MPSEFELIRACFADATKARADVMLGIGDDCALLRPPQDRVVATSCDTLVSGRHFLSDVAPDALGHKCLAVNLSDLAAMGAEPAWACLALTLPGADETWLRSFMSGFSALAARYGVQLVGGDTTRGPLSITIQVQGFVDPAHALRRDGAVVGDQLFVSGQLGDAALALRQQRAGTEPGEAQRRRLDRPSPRVELGRLLAGRASAAIDVSDGLLADLSHICAASGVGARLRMADLPLSAAVDAACRAGDRDLPLSGGDDYELLFCVSPGCVDETVRRCRDAGESVTRIGEMVAGDGLHLVHPDGRETREGGDGFDHFRV